MDRFPQISSLRNAGGCVVLLIIASLGCGREKPERPPIPGVSERMLLDAQSHTDKWIHYGRNYAAWRYVPLDAINRETVTRLEPKWIYPTGISKGAFETTAIAFEGKLYITTSDGHLMCLRIADGSLVWRYDHRIEDYVRLCCGPVNRGVAIRGEKIYFCTLDAHLVCLDAESGLVLWERTVGDYRESYSMTLAPLIIGEKVLVGVSGGVFGVRGFLDAYHADTGERLWRFYTTPGPGETGHDTWEGDSWQRGGAPVWITGTYDPELNITYWGVGNPSPVHDGSVREGDNLYSDCIIALNPDTGELLWHFQTTPHDIFDWDAMSEPILVDERINGIDVKALVQFNRNGFVYALDRTDGELLYAKPYSDVTWAEFDADGVPRLKPELQTPGDTPMAPGVFGAKNWSPAAYNPNTHLFYTPDMYLPSIYTITEAEYRPGLPYRGGSAAFPAPEFTKGYLKAVEAQTGETAWSVELPGGPTWAGALATAGGLVFAGAQDGRLRAFNDETGDILWEYDVGEPIIAPPTSFEYEGAQYIGLAVGWRQPTAEGSKYFLFGLLDRSGDEERDE